MLFGQLAVLMAQSQRLFFFLLLGDADMFQLFGKRVNLGFQALHAHHGLHQSPLAVLALHGDFAQLALQSQRTTRSLLAAADRIAVVANAIRQQEVDVGILQSQPLGGLAILGEKAARQTRQQIGRGMREAVG